MAAHGLSPRTTPTTLDAYHLDTRHPNTDALRTALEAQYITTNHSPDPGKVFLLGGGGV